jgi:hypothetical protein
LKCGNRRDRGRTSDINQSANFRTNQDFAKLVKIGGVFDDIFNGDFLLLSAPTLGPIGRSCL